MSNSESLHDRFLTWKRETSQSSDPSCSNPIMSYRAMMEKVKESGTTDELNFWAKKVAKTWDALKEQPNCSMTFVEAVILIEEMMQVSNDAGYESRNLPPPIEGLEALYERRRPAFRDLYTIHKVMGS